MTIPDDAIAKAYTRAIGYANLRAVGKSDETRQSLIDSATDGVMWARDNCHDAAKFVTFARSVVRCFVERKLSKTRQRREARPAVESLPEQVEGRATKPTRPTLINDLPEELAFCVRLYMVDGFTMREIGLLTGVSPNTVDLRLKRAAALLAPGEKLPKRRKGEKRLSAR